MSPDDRIACFLDQVCCHLYWPPYRARVRRELTDHILSRAEYLQNERGYLWEDAVNEALKSLGEPNDIGRSLRHARFPAGSVLFLLGTALIWAAMAACLVYLAMYFVL